MPFAAIAAAILCLARLTFVSDAFVASHPIGALIQALTEVSILLSVLYYGPKAIRWLWRKTLWRVRRRLAITYLFVGLTPIVLMGALGLLAGFVVSAESMARGVRQEMRSAEEAASTAAHGLVVELQGLLPGATTGTIEKWVAEKGASIRSSLPGARLALWLGDPGRGESSAASAPIVSAPGDESSRPIGPDASPEREPLPSWLDGTESFHALIFVPPPEGSDGLFGSGSIRALRRGGAAGRRFDLLVTLPVSRSLVTRLHDATRMEIHPYFLKKLFEANEPGLHVATTGPSRSKSRNMVQLNVDGAEIGARSALKRDQLGAPLPETPYFVVVSATDWETGKPADRIGFIFSWSWSAAAGQILGNTAGGQFWKLALIAVGVTFLGLEILALLAALLITREVTGTVHELQLATEAVRRGDFSYRAKKNSHDQLGELADAFNDMSAHVEILLDERVERERMQREIEIAADVQSRLFPTSAPSLASAEITGECRAARGVAGDYYDYIMVGPGLVALALADVSGKGISASLLMSNLQASLRAQAGILGDGSAPFPAGAAGGPAASGAVARLASSLNKQLCRSTDINRYATLFLGLYDEATRVLRYTNAGHNAAVLVQPDGSLARLSLGGTIVGAFDGARYEESLAGLAAGAVLVIFSDGISEAMNVREEEFGEQRIADFAIANRRLPAEEIRQRLFDEVDRWSVGVERNDDQTLVILKAKDGAS